MGEKAESGEGLEHVVQIDLDKDKTYLHDNDSECQRLSLKKWSSLKSWTK